MLIGASIVANFFNFLYNAYLGRRISVEEFGLVSLIGSFLYLSSIPIGALGKTVSHRSAYLLGKYETSSKQFWSHIRKRAILVSLAITALWLAASPALGSFFNAKSFEPFIIFAPVWFIGLVSTVDSGFLTGNLKFKILALLVICESFLKFLFSMLLVEFGYTRFVYAAIPISLAIVLLIGWTFARSIKETRAKAVDRKVLLKFPRRFYLTSILTKVSTVAYLSFDIILAKHFLPPKEAGEYALLSLIGKMIFFVGSLFSQFINPVVSREEGAQKSSRIVFYKLLFLTAISAFGAYLTVGVFGFWTAPILFGEKVQPITHLLPIYGFGIFCFSVAASFVTFYQVRQKHLLAFVSFLIALAQIIGIVFYHQELNQIVNVMNAVGIASLVVMIFLHFAYQPFTAVARNISDLLELFSLQIEKSPTSSGRLRILIFNWRDMKHIWSGGSELYIHEIAKELVKNGHPVTIFCGNDGKSKRSEVIDRVQIIRHGGFYTVYFWAFLYYIFKLRKYCDVIVDSENGIPFFTPFYARKPIIGLVHHVHQEVFRRHLKFPFTQIAQFLEAKLMPFVYRNVKMVTVSKSSKEEMEVLDLGRRQPIEIINPGVDLDKFKPGAKSEVPSILYLGRLKPYKSIETAIYAMEKLIKNVPNATLTIAGDGESRKNLEALVNKLGLGNLVKFKGKVSEEIKSKLLAKAWVMVQPSSMEGWGITTIEANASGTPVIAANVPGLRDSIKNPHSGILVPWGDTSKFARKIEEVLTDKSLRRYLEAGSREWAKNFSWEKSASIFERILEHERNRFKTKSINTSSAERN